MNIRGSLQKLEGEYKRAIELNPNYPTAHHWYSQYLDRNGAVLTRGLAEIERAHQPSSFAHHQRRRCTLATSGGVTSMRQSNSARGSSKTIRIFLLQA